MSVHSADVCVCVSVVDLLISGVFNSWCAADVRSELNFMLYVFRSLNVYLFHIISTHSTFVKTQ